MDNRRSNPRQRSFMQGRIYFNKRKSSLDCVVRDLSEVGAKLKVSNSIALPEVIEFYIPSKQQTYRAKIERRTADEIGIAFIAEHASPSIVPDAPAVDLAARVHRLETEFAALQRKVNELRTERDKRQNADI
jgi:hypothetical protein